MMNLLVSIFRMPLLEHDLMMAGLPSFAHGSLISRDLQGEAKLGGPCRDGREDLKSNPNPNRLTQP